VTPSRSSIPGREIVNDPRVLSHEPQKFILWQGWRVYASRCFMKADPATLERRCVRAWQAMSLSELSGALSIPGFYEPR